MAPIQRKTMNNPYKTGSASPLQNPLVMVLGVAFLLFVILNIFSSDSNSEIEDEHSKLRSAKSASEMTEEDLNKLNKPEGKEDVQLQQEIVPEGEDGQEPIRVKPMEDYEFDDMLMFNHFVKGKSASVIEDMFMAHAHAFHSNAIYGGACRSDPNISVEKHEKVLDAIGLKESLKFACPTDYRDKQKKATIPEEFYHKVDTRAWTPAYVAYLKSLVRYPVKRDDEYVIAVHVRRGKTTPCKSKVEGYNRYLPNVHYLNLIEKYNKPGARVVIYAESESFEPLSEFEEKGYEVERDTELATMWKTFLTADVLILSRSDLSMLPAVVTMGTVVYTPFWHSKLREWDKVPKDIMETSDQANELLIAEKCDPQDNEI